MSPKATTTSGFWGLSSSTTHYERVKTQVDAYQIAVKETLRDLLPSFGVRLFYIAGVLIATVVPVLLSDIVAKASALGLGGSNFFANRKDWDEYVIGYLKDWRRLRASARRIKLRFLRCDPKDDAILTGVEDEIEKALEEIEQEAKTD